MGGHGPRSDIEAHNPGKIRGMAILSADELLKVLGAPSAQEPAGPYFCNAALPEQRPFRQINLATTFACRVFFEKSASGADAHKRRVNKLAASATVCALPSVTISP
jgi:hypothetical protein